MRIYFDNTLLNDFMDYAMKKKAENEKQFRMMKYFTFEDVKALAKYYSEGKKIYCTDKGQTFFEGEEYASTPSKIWLADGKCLDNYADIVAHEKEEFKTDRAGYIEYHIFHWIWCTIERILRCNHQNIIDDYDKRILNKAKKQFENQIA